MHGIPNSVRASITALMLFATVIVLAQSTAENQEAREEIRVTTDARADECTRCYKQLQATNTDCEAMTGLDWKICRDAAEVAYRRCSEGC